MSRKRGEVRALALSVLLLALPLFALPAHGLVLLTPSVVGGLPSTIELNFSAPVMIMNATLSDEQAGTIVAQYASAAFHDVDGQQRLFTLDLNATLRLQPGSTYHLYIAKNDSQPPNNQLPPDVVEFDYFPAGSELDVQLAMPRRLSATPSLHALATGFSQSAPYDVTVNTTKGAQCWYSPDNIYDPGGMSKFNITGSDASPATVHVAEGLSDAEIYPFIVYCNNTETSVGSSFDVGYEEKPPNFTVTLTPARIVDPNQMSANMSVESDQKVYCKAEGNGGTLSFAERYGLSANDAGAYEYSPWAMVQPGGHPTQPTIIPYLITCTDRAGRSSQKQMNVTIDLQSTPSLSLLSPDTYTRQSDVLFAVEVLKGGVAVQSDSCFFTDTPAPSAALSSTDQTVYNASFPGLPDGNYTHAVRCVISGGTRVEKSFTFTVDTSPPPGAPERTLAAPAFICGAGLLNATATLAEDTDEDVNFAGYLFNITYSTGPKVFFAGSSISGDLSARGFVPIENKTYRWNVWPYDLAGNAAAAPLSADTVVYPANDSHCDLAAPTATLVAPEQESPARVLIWVNCTDNAGGVGCDSTYNYSIQEPGTACAYDAVESYNNSDGTPRYLDFYTDQELCYRVYDMNGNARDYAEEIDLADYSPHVNFTSPARYVATRSVSVLVDAAVGDQALQSARCGFVLPSSAAFLSAPLAATDASNTSFAATVTVPSDGDFLATVNCTLLSGSSVRGGINFTVDTSAPSHHLLEAPATLCLGQSLRAKASHDSHWVLDLNFAGYTYQLSYGSGDIVLANGSVPASGILTYGRTTVNETYRWSVSAFDRANNSAPVDGSPATTEVLPAGATACDTTPPTAAVSIAVGNGSANATVSCADAGSGCDGNFYWSLLPPRSAASACTYVEATPLTENATLQDSGLFCYMVLDKNMNNATGAKSVTIPGAARPSHCSDGQLELSLGETDIDCGGACAACGAGKMCNASSDCSTGLCAGNVCSQDACSDGVKDGYETGIDCGGDCSTACVAGSNCTTGKDCSSSFCNGNNTCESTSCSDSVQNGYETGVDCGGPSCSPCEDGKACEGSSDCASGSCESGLCANATPAAGCAHDTDCSTDGTLVCDTASGQCVPSSPAPKPTPCTLDSDCTVAGTTCDTATSTCVQKANATGASLIGIILIILGLLTMAGSGYWLYYLHQGRVEEEQERRQSSERGYAPAPQELTSEQRLALLKQRQAQLAALRQQQERAAQQRAAAKEAQRQGVISSLEGKPSTPSAADAKTTQTGPQPRQEVAGEEKPDDGFVDLAELAKLQPLAREPAQPSASPAKQRKKAGKRESDAFSDLDKVIGGR